MTPPPVTPPPVTPPPVTPPPVTPPVTPPSVTPPPVTPTPVAPECVPAAGQDADCVAVEGEKNGPGRDRPTSTPPAAPVRVLAQTGGNGVPGLVTMALLSVLAGCLLLAAAAHGRPGRR